MTRTLVVAAMLVVCGVQTVQGGIIGYWRFEEGAGTSSADASGNSNSATLANGASWTTDIAVNPVPHNGLANSHALALGGAKYAHSGPSTDLDPSSAITVEAWVKRETAGTFDAGIVGRQYGTNFKNSYNLFTRTGQTSVGFEITNTLGQTAAAEVFSNPLTVGTWYHVAGVYNGTEIQLYIDGILKASKPFSGDIGYARANRVLFGADNEGNPFNPTWYFPGIIDEARISDTALSPGQFLNAPQPVPEPSLFGLCMVFAFVAVAYYRHKHFSQVRARSA